MTLQRLNDIICTFIAASVFLMIGLESAQTNYPTHSGTQPLSRHAATLPRP